MNTLRTVTIAVLLCVFPLAMVQAYIPTAEQILESLARMHRRVSTVIIHSETTLYRNDQSGLALHVPETLSMEKGGAFRSERRMPEGTVILAGQEGRAFVSVADSDLVDLRRIESVLPGILLQRSTDRLIHDLSVLGVDTSVTSFDRIEKSVCYVLGISDSTPSGSALWVEKERGLPLRFAGFLAMPEGIVALRAEYKDYGLVNDRFWFPRKIEFYQDDLLLALMEIRKIETDPPVDGALFDTAKNAASGYPLPPFMSIKE